MWNPRSIRSRAARCALSYASSASTKASIWAAKRSLIEVERLAARTLAFCTVCGFNLTVTFCFRIWVILHSAKIIDLSDVRRSARSPGSLRNAKLALQLLERNSFRFRVDEQHDKELQRRHGGKECERQSARVLSEHRKKQRDDRVHNPV